MNRLATQLKVLEFQNKEVFTPIAKDKDSLKTHEEQNQELQMIVKELQYAKATLEMDIWVF